MYNYLFYLIYRFLTSVELGNINETQGSRVQLTIMTISFLELMNLMSILPNTFKGYVISIPLVLLLLINYLIFGFRARYKSVITFKAYRKSYRPLTIAYIIGTVLYLTISRYWLT